MKEALGNYMAMACGFDRLCLTDTSYSNVVENFSWVKDLTLEYVKKHGHRVLNVGLKDTKPSFLYTPFQLNNEQCNPSIICDQLIQYANKNGLNYIAIPRPNNYDEIKGILSSKLDDRFIVMVDDPKYLGIVSEEIDDGKDYPSLEDETAPVVVNAHPGVCVTGPRPKNIYGYYATQKWTALQNKIYACCNQLHNEFGVKRFGNGCAQGVDMSFYFVVEYIRSKDPEVQNICYRPFANHGENFGTGAFNVTEYSKMLSTASAVKVLGEAIPNGSPKYVYSQALLSRNNVMIDDFDYVIGVYGGDRELIKNDVAAPSGTLHALRYAYSQNKKIILIDPNTLVAERFNF